jgi:hypothetical protein
MTRRYWGVAAVASILIGLPVAFLSLDRALSSLAFVALIAP